MFQQVLNFFGTSSFRFHITELEPHLPPMPGLHPRPCDGCYCYYDRWAECDQELAQVSIARRVSGKSRNLQSAFAKALLDRVQFRLVFVAELGRIVRRTHQGQLDAIL